MFDRHSLKRPSITPFGFAEMTTLVAFSGPLLPMWLARGNVGTITSHPWNLIMVDEYYALAELTPVTLAYSNNGGGLFNDGEKGWACFNYDSIECAMLAWDHAPFLEQINFLPGVATIHEGTNSDWLSLRRSWCYDALRVKKPAFLIDFFAQYKRVKSDDL